MEDLFEFRDRQAEKYRKRIKALCRRAERQNDRVAELEAALKDCIDYVDVDNLTMQHKERAWKTVLAGGKWLSGNVEADAADLWYEMY